MPRRFRRGDRPKDVNQLAYQLVRESTEQEPPQAQSHQSEVSRIMSEMGRKGGKIGGKRRLETLTAEERSDLASKAARDRWKKSRRNGKP